VTKDLILKAKSSNKNSNFVLNADMRGPRTKAIAWHWRS